MLDLVDDPLLIADYEACHAPGCVWPEVLASIRRSGILSMRIYRLGTRLAMVLTVENRFSFTDKAASDAADPLVQRWEARMARFQRALPGASDEGKWRGATRIFETPSNAPV